MQADSSRERRLIHVLKRGAKRVLPRTIVRAIVRMMGHPLHEIPIGSVRFGDLGRMYPFDERYGWGRGTPIDRYYIESFLARNAGDICGCVLELADNRYTKTFGGARVERSDVLSIEATNPNATIVGDLVETKTLPEAAFDCIIFTQALQFIFDLRAAVFALHRALKPGGVLLVTVPGLTPTEDAWPWYWTFTAAALRRLLEDRFEQNAVSVELHGNVFVATAFLFGLAKEELEISSLNARDPKYPVIVAGRAIKRTGES